MELIQASKDGDLKNVKKKIKNGANVHAYEDASLHWAAHNGHLEVVKYLVSKGANVRAEDDDALVHAVHQGHLEIVKFLIDRGADVHARDDYTLRMAVKYRYLEIVKYLKTYYVLQFIKKHTDKQIHIEKLNQVLKGIRALPGIGIDYLYAVEQFNHLKTIC